MYILGKDDDLHTTVSIILQESLQPDDEVIILYVIQMCFIYFCRYLSPWKYTETMEAQK